MEWLARNDFDVLPAVEQLARQATLRAPGNPSTWRWLGESQLMAGHVAQAIESLRAALRSLPDDQTLRLLLARACQRAGRFEEGIAVMDEYVRANPADSAGLLRRFELLCGAEWRDCAQEAAAEVERIAPLHPDLVLLAADRAFEGEGGWEELLNLCDRQMALAPGNTGARYHRALALTMVGRNREAAETMDIDRFVSIRHPAAPEGYGDVAEFCAALREEVLRNPTLSGDPRGKATRQGLQTAQLEQPGASAVEALLSLVRLEVGRYAAELPDTDDPFVGARPARARLESWAVVYGGEGRQNSHIHPSGWLSGTFYVTTPDSPAENNEGRLVLGALKSRMDATPPWGLRFVDPTPGRMVFFPSWLPHSTVPTNCADLRICIAYDVIPVD